LIATVVFLVLRVKKGGLPGAFSKTGASLAFVMLGVAAVFDRLQDPAGIIVNQTFNRWSLFILVGLVAGLIGDIFLDLKFIVLDKTDAFTFAGFASFIFCHVMYLVMLWNCMVFPIWVVFLAIAFGAIAALFILFNERRMGVKYGKFKAISVVYAGILVFFSTMCLGIMITNKYADATVMLYLGSLLFLISDFILCGTYFGENKNTPPYVLANHITYYLAQILIASSILKI
jgi:hypothetical protein